MIRPNSTSDKFQIYLKKTKNSHGGHTGMIFKSHDAANRDLALYVWCKCKRKHQEAVQVDMPLGANWGKASPTGEKWEYIRSLLRASEATSCCKGGSSVNKTQGSLSGHKAVKHLLSSF